MIFNKGMSLVMTIVDAGFSTKVIEASKKAGADGATILNGRGTSIHESSTFLGVAIQPEKEIVMILVKKSQRKEVMRAVVKECNLTTEGKGLTFAVPIDEVAGSPHLFNKKKQNEMKKPDLKAETVEQKGKKLESLEKEGKKE